MRSHTRLRTTLMLSAAIAVAAAASPALAQTIVAPEPPTDAPADEPITGLTDVIVTATFRA